MDSNRIGENRMKRFRKVMITVLLITVMTVPVSAETRRYVSNKSNWSECGAQYGKWYNAWKNWKDKSKNAVILPDLDENKPVITLVAPNITEAKYQHKCPYYGMHPELIIRWDEVSGAESYEIEVTKADGTVLDYTSTYTSLIDRGECPRVYIESTSTWASATVKVRAVDGNEKSEWSTSRSISCDMLHF